MLKLEELHNRFKEMPKISPFLIKRYTKFGWDDCDEIYEELKEMRLSEGIDKPDRKKWERIK